MRTRVWFLSLFSVLVVVAVSLHWARPLQRPDESLPGTRPRTIFLPYYRVSQDLQSSMTLNNTTRAPMVVQPTIYSNSGAGVPVSPVRLESHQAVPINLSDWISGLGGDFQEGSVRLDFESVNFGLGAQIKVVNEQQSLVFDVPSHLAGEFMSSSLEAIWWAPDPQAALSLVAVNTTDAQVMASLRVTDANGAEVRVMPLPLGPHQQRSVELLDVIRSTRQLSGGLVLTHDSSPGAVMAEAFVSQPQTGFSGTATFFDTSTFQVSKLEGAGVLLGAGLGSGNPPKRFGGRLMLRNTSGVEVSVSAAIQAGTSAQSIGTLTLGPGQTREITVQPDQIMSTADPIGIEVTYDGTPGSIIGQWYSVDESGSLVVEAPLRNYSARHHGGGNHPWSLDGDNSAVVYVKNAGTTPAEFVANIWYPGGVYMIGLKKLKAGESAAFDIRKLRDDQVPDVEKRTLPAELVSGQFQWRWHGGSPLAGRLNLMSGSKGIANSMSCPTCCCSPTDGFIFLAPAQTDADSFTGVQEVIWEQDIGCDGFPIPPYPRPDIDQSHWESNNPIVASVDNGGFVTTFLPGTATVTVFGYIRLEQQVIFYDDPFFCDRVCQSFEEPVSASAGFTVRNLSGFQLVVVSGTPESDSVVSGQAGTVEVRAIDSFGATFDRYRGTIHFSSSDAAATLPVDYSFTENDAGVHRFSATLRTVAGNSATRDLAVQDVNNGISGTNSFYVWFQVIATREGLVGQTTACGHVITQSDHFVALPATGLCNAGVRLRNGSILATTAILDVGPWCPNAPVQGGFNQCSCSSDRYWQTTGIPFAASASCATSHAGIDLADGTFSDLGLTTNGPIYWRFQ